MTTAILAEDEPLLAAALQAELAALWPALQVVSVAPNGMAAHAALLEHAPDVAFLDIRMPGMSGIEVAQALVEDWSDERPPPLLAFVTAFDEFAVDAFAHAAVDYVLKPVQSERLAVTVERLQARLAEREAAAADGGSGRRAEVSDTTSLEALAEQMRRLMAVPDPVARGRDTAPLRVIRAGVGDTVRMIRIDEVVYLQAADKYVNVVTAQGEALIRESLRDLLPRLDPERFVQVHRGTVVNLDFVRAAVRDDTGKLSLQLQGRAERPTVSRLYAHLFRAM